MRNKRNTDSDN